MHKESRDVSLARAPPQKGCVIVDKLLQAPLPSAVGAAGVEVRDSQGCLWLAWSVSRVLWGTGPVIHLGAKAASPVLMEKVRLNFQNFHL